MRTHLACLTMVAASLCLPSAVLSQTSVPANPAEPAGITTEAPAEFDALRGDRHGGWLGQTRSEVVGMNGMVATSQPLGVEAGLEILRAGGNAFDAAIAVAAMMNVVEPEAAGIGGDAFILAWSARDQKLVALDGSGRAPAGYTLERLIERGEANVPRRGIDSAVVPGAVDAWDVLLKSQGTMSFAQVLEPAARIAEEGFGLTERIADGLAGGLETLQSDPETARVHLVDGAAPPVYSVFRNPDLARALRLLMEDGRDAFYKGPIAEALVARSQELGGTFSMADLDGIAAQWVEPITSSFDGYDVHQMPPSTQGFAVLQIMNMLEVCPAILGLDPAQLNPRSVEYWHLMIEAKKLAYDDLRQFNGDPDFSEIPTERLISKAYAAEQCARIDPARASLLGAAPEPIGGTAYLTTADRYGNVVSMIYSIYGYFGSGVTVPGYGFLLNNRAGGFSLDPESPNVVAPGKRPYYTIIPGFVTRGGQPLLAFGVMSGDQQAQGQAQVLANMLRFGANPQAASDAARFSHNQRTNRLTLETELFAEFGEALAALGHDVVAGNGAGMGGYQAIMVNTETGVLRGASDHRKDGQAFGY